MTGLAMLAEQIGVSERTLRRAVNEGTLRAVRPTPRTLEMSLAERDYARRKWSLLSTLRATLRTEPNVRLASLFGSIAADRDTAESDVDVLVDLSDDSLDRVIDLTLKLEEALGKTVDLVRLAEAESEPLLLARALESGRVLVVRDRRWPSLCRRVPGLLRFGLAEKDRRARAALDSIDRLLAA
ncbi:MAG: nucleotidyltransferase domain-containing protein [Solirubrobacteraceae bacterium]